MGRPEAPTRPGVSLGDVTAVLELAGRHRDAGTPVPASWDEVLAQVRAPQGAPGQHESTGAVRGTSS